MSFDNFKFAETDARIIAEKMKDLYEAIRRAGGEPGFRLADGDPIRLIQSTEAAMLAQTGSNIDATGKSSLLRFAGEETIEKIGELYGERGRRLQASVARCTLRFTLSTVMSSVTIIPQGRRVTADNQIFFVTIKTLEISAGELTGEVEAVCLTPGRIGNGFTVGMIKNMADSIPFVSAAENITESAGGTDIEDIESYRERLRLLPESFSVAGPDGAYEFWAKTAHQGIIDVRVWMPEYNIEAFMVFLREVLGSGISPNLLTEGQAETFRERLTAINIESGTGPGNVNVVALMQDGELPTTEVNNMLYTTLNDKRVRPLTDRLHVKTPEVIEYGIHIKYWINSSNATMVSSIQNAVNNAIADFIKWQKTGLGIDVNPSVLHNKVMEAGVKRLEIITPAFKVLEMWQVAYIAGEPLIEFIGLEDI